MRGGTQRQRESSPLTPRSLCSLLVPHRVPSPASVRAIVRFSFHRSTSSSFPSLCWFLRFFFLCLCACVLRASPLSRDISFFSLRFFASPAGAAPWRPPPRRSRFILLPCSCLCCFFHVRLSVCAVSWLAVSRGVTPFSSPAAPSRGVSYWQLVAALNTEISNQQGLCTHGVRTFSLLVYSSPSPTARSPAVLFSFHHPFLSRSSRYGRVSRVRASMRAHRALSAPAAFGVRQPHMHYPAPAVSCLPSHAQLNRSAFDVWSPPLPSPRTIRRHPVACHAKLLPPPAALAPRAWLRRTVSRSRYCAAARGCGVRCCVRRGFDLSW